ncbi:glycosyltransferase family 2 protein [Atopococcus tabaci]|uniref:glycosyltransferase family 2 protein n=1 Tax=Atopococcus tabaci TaxID=269774 RepID=UPI0004235C63|nr:glycosyltransferase family 2 protein [Atopococcus tabaci]
MTKVSVVMPVYNGEKFLKQAVDSIRNQTMEDIEIILVNDQSTDASGRICDELKEEDSRIHVIHLEENKGICGARNAGLRAAKGEYVAFCDNDDFFLPNLIADNYSLAKEYDADMVKFGRKLIDVDSNGNVLREKETPLKELAFYDTASKMTHYFSIKSKGLLMNVWNGMYRLSSIKEKDIWFNEFMRFGSEDADFSYRFFLSAEKIVVNPYSYYVHYRRNDFSTSRKFSMNKLESMVLASESEARIFELMPDTAEIKARKIIEINKLIMNMYTQQVFHEENPMTLKERIQYLSKIKSHEHLNYELDSEIKKELKKIKKKHLPFSKAYANGWNQAAYGLLKIQYLMNNEKW